MERGPKIHRRLRASQFHVHHGKGACTGCSIQEGHNLARCRSASLPTEHPQPLVTRSHDFVPVLMTARVLRLPLSLHPSDCTTFSYTPYKGPHSTILPDAHPSVRAPFPLTPSQRTRPRPTPPPALSHRTATPSASYRIILRRPPTHPRPAPSPATSHVLPQRHKPRTHPPASIPAPSSAP